MRERYESTLLIIIPDSSVLSTNGVGWPDDTRGEKMFGDEACCNIAEPFSTPKI